MLRLGSPLFHFGMLGVLGGHIVGLLVPRSWTEAVGIDDHLYHYLAVVGGLIAGIMATVGLVILILHGLVDDTLYGSRAQFMLWVLPGLAQAVVTRPVETTGLRKSDPVRRTQLLATGGVVLVVALVYLVMFGGAIGVVWRANLAAVQMAQIELDDFPTGVWDDGSRATAAETGRIQ